MSAFLDVLARHADEIGARALVWGLTDAADVAGVRILLPGVSVQGDDLAARDGAAWAHAPWPEGGCFDDVVVFAPQGRARQRALAAAAVAVAAGEGARLWCIGETRLLGRGAAALLGESWRDVEKVDAARHCAVLVGRPGSAPAPESFVTRYDTRWRGVDVEVFALAGVFSADALDPGTAMLLDHIDVPASGERVLDFGCGAGVVAACLAAAGRDARVTAVDTSAVALRSTQMTASRNALSNVEVIGADGLGEVDGVFDRIVSNPPFHAGAAVDLRDTMRFFAQAAPRLAAGGTLTVVANRFLPYLDAMRASFRVVDVVAHDTRFAVYRASQPDFAS